MYVILNGKMQLENCYILAANNVLRSIGQLIMGEGCGFSVIWYNFPHKDRLQSAVQRMARSAID